VTQDLGGGWTAETTGPVLDGGILSDADATGLFFAIALTGLLLGILLFVLATGRERARVQLLQRTGQLKHQALHDALTGLPNRTLVEDRMEQMLIRARRHRTTGAALFLDIDDFKNVNDTLGHAVGDRLLVAVTERLDGALRDADTVGRMGGDEFVVLVDGTDGEVSPEMVAQRLLDVMQVPFVLDGVHSPVVVSMSIGVAAGDRTTPGDLLRDADLALYEAKAAGKNQYKTFDADMHTDLTRRTDLEFDLRSALPGGQYRLMYQPMYDLGDLKVIGVEALLRWDHPTLGTISPDEFIPLLERSGQIVEVGRWVLNEACQQMAEWHARGDTLDLSVNVSGRQLDYPGIVDDVRAAIDRSGLTPDALIVEITESVLMYNVENTTQRLHEIKRLGVRVAIDDFGTGYSSLAYLSTFPVDCLKIDRAFTSAITTSEQSRALVHTLVRMAKDLGLSTLAEGIETTGEMDLVRAADVDQAQGFLMAKPLDPAVLEAQLLLPMRAPHATATSSDPT
jgi:diguanylate cyclase (GGDEF)-like protein